MCNACDWQAHLQDIEALIGSGKATGQRMTLDQIRLSIDRKNHITPQQIGTVKNIMKRDS